MRFSRLDRINSELKKVLLEAVYYESSDAKFKNVIIDSVEVSRDLSFARVKILRNEAISPEIVGKLNKAVPFFRKIIAKQMKSLKYIPSLKFEVDIDNKDVSRVLELIDNISNERKKNDLKDKAVDVNLYKNIISFLNESENILLCAHVNPDGDALGALSGISQYLNNIGKKNEVYTSHIIPEEFDFIFKDLGIDSINQVKSFDEYDCIVVLDVGSLHRVGIEGIENYSDKIINIDHHISNDGIGKYSVVEPKCSSTGEIIFNIFNENDIEITPSIANALYTAIYTDTGKYSYENTTSDTLNISSKLVQLGARPYKIYTSIYENRSEQEVRLFAEVISTLKIFDDKKVAAIYLSKKDFEKYQVNPFTLKEIVNFVRGIKNVEVSVFLKELSDNKYKASLRSKGKVDVNKIAAEFGGGGHHNASGAVMFGTIEKILDDLLKFF